MCHLRQIHEFKARMKGPLISAQLRDYLTFRAKQEGTTCNLTAKWVQRKIDAGYSSFFGVSIGAGFIERDDQNPKAFREYFASKECPVKMLDSGGFSADQVALINAFLREEWLNCKLDRSATTAKTPNGFIQCSQTFANAINSLK